MELLEVTDGLNTEYKIERERENQDISFGPEQVKGQKCHLFPLPIKRNQDALEK